MVEKFVLSTKDFHASTKERSCFPMKYKQGCYGDCSDCCSRWFERINKMKELPFVIVNIVLDKSFDDYNIKYEWG